MKGIKRILSVLMMLILLVSMNSMAALAAVPSASDKADVKITGFGDKTPSVTLYKIWEGNYGGSTFSWDKVAGTEGVYEEQPDNSFKPVAAVVQDVAAKLKAGTLTPKGALLTKDVAGGEFTANVGAGVYIAVITPKEGDENVYNPVILAAAYDGTSLSGGSVAIGENFNGKIEGTAAAVKKSTPDVKKEAKATTDATKGETDNQTAAVGQIVTYTVTPTMPQYPAGATNKTFYFSDTMSKGLTFDFSSLTIKWNEKTLTADGAGDFKDGATLIAKAKKVGNGFNLSFVYDNLKFKSPTLEYKAILNKDAVVGQVGNDNKIEMYYSNKPNEGSTYDNVESKPQEGSGLIKKEDSEKVYTYQISFKKTGEGQESAKLAGAVFGVYSDEACTKLVDTVTTNAEGYAISTQVGFGSYWVKEISAPAGYTLNTRAYKVESQWTSATTKTSNTTITTEYTSNASEASVKVQAGWLKDNIFYNLDNKPAGSDSEVLKAYVKNTTSNTATSESFEKNQAAGSGTLTLEDIPNTKTPGLPSTGSTGTYLFTIFGVALLAAAAYLVINGKKVKN